MKKVVHIIVVIFTFMVFNIDVMACKGSDGCTNCGNSSAEIACKQSASYKQYINGQNSQSCESRCNGIQSASAKEECLENCQAGGTGGGGGSTGGGGTTPGQTPGTGSPTQTIGEQTETITMESEDDDNLECDTLFGTNTAVGKYVHYIYNILKFAVPIILLAMSIKDFGTAIISQNDDGVKKATNTFIKRLIIAILILIVPTLLNFILDILEIDTCFL